MELTTGSVCVKSLPSSGISTCVAITVFAGGSRWLLQLLYGSIPSYTESFSVRRQQTALTSTQKSTSSFVNLVWDVNKSTILSMICIYLFNLQVQSKIIRRCSAPSGWSVEQVNAKLNDFYLNLFSNIIYTLTHLCMFWNTKQIN